MSISCTAEFVMTIPESKDGGTLALRCTQCINGEIQVSGTRGCPHCGVARIETPHETDLDEPPP